MVAKSSAVVVLLLLAVISLFGTAPGQQNGASSVVIPSGTNITVKLNYQNHAAGSNLEGKVVWPVQIGFTTVIPVGSRVKAATFTQYNDTDRRHTNPIEFVQLVTITVGDKTYEVESNALPMERGTAETKFTLVADVKIER